LNSLLLESYSKDELITAKQILVTIFEKCSNSDAINASKKSRIGQNVESKLVKDIIDTERGGQLQTQFVAADPTRLPSINADKYNLQFLIASILKLQEQNNVLQSQLESVTESFTAIHDRLPSSFSLESIDTPSDLDKSRKRRLDATLPSFVLVKDSIWRLNFRR